MELIKNYKLTGNLVIASNKDEREVYAVSELRYYLSMMIGNPVVAKCVESAEDDAVIVLGSARALYGEELETFEYDELHWYVKNSKIFIDGGRHGLLYGVYDFLESLGCRFFAKDCEKIPTYENLELADTDRRDKPVYQYRSIYHHDCCDPVFAMKRRTNFNVRIPDYMGGDTNKKVAGLHSFPMLMPYNKYFKIHPEWYALYNGARGWGDYVDTSKKQYWDLCLTNPDLIAELIKNTREYLREHPDTDIMNISQNDSGAVCQCENCMAVDKEEGCRSGLVLRTINTIAEALEEEFPNVLFEHLAYVQNENLPKKTKPRHNVTIKLCSAHCCVLHPITDSCPRVGCGDAKYPPFIENLNAWGSFGLPLSVWDYVTNFPHYSIPHPNWRVLQPNLQVFAENNAFSMFQQGNVSPNGGVDLEELRCYLISTLMWNPYCDADKLIEEFTDYYYGDAGKFVREYIKTICDCAYECGEHFNCVHGSDLKYLAPEYLAKYEEIIDRGLETVKDNPIIAARVYKIKLSFKYTRVHQQFTANHDHNAAAINELFSEFKAYNIYGFEEGLNYQDSFYAFLHELPRARYGRELWEVK